ncbi:MAG: hypothetical protein ACI91F_003459, partial [Candidatus Binatia bacterium]
SRWLWNAERFGVTPTKLAQRAAVPGLPPVLSISLPKAGTHLLERALCRTPGLRRKLLPTIHDANIERWGELGSVLKRLGPGQIAVGHLAHSHERAEAIRHHSVRAVFMIRDPRDIVISQAHYIMSRTDHPQHRAFASAPDLASRVLIAIRGNATLDSLGTRLRAYSGWCDDDQVFTVRFEDLVGPDGGGDQARQSEALRGLYRHLGIVPSDEQMADIQAGLFAPTSPTFRHGLIGKWREVFDETLTAAFREDADAELAAYGYDWEQGGSEGKPTK